MQKHVNLVDLVKSFPTNIFLQNLASIQKRTSPIMFAHLAEKSEKGSISNLSTKTRTGRSSARCDAGRRADCGAGRSTGEAGALPPNTCVKFITKYAQNASKRNVSTVHGHAFPKDLRASTVKVYDIKLISYLKILS